MLESATDPEGLQRARLLLRPPAPPDHRIGAVAAAALFAFAGVSLALTVILAPPLPPASRLR